MPLSAGDRLGPYEVTGELGAGGMGIVLRATDTQLHRDVALKILPDAFAADPDRLARFQREAQVLASLNHPGIAAIYGIEEDEVEGRRALILELVEGPTLADRIAQGAMPIEDALPIAKQIAEALEAAHEAGVIHRDLKPANIKVREDGTVKVLDFGLAKALDPSPTGDPSQSPTLTAAATRMGVIMGTAAYMSPEQARGKPVDKRADIWAFGVVLYEMLAGARPFQGEDVSLTLASVMKSDVNVKTLPRDVPVTVRTVLHRCLEKDPSRRIRDVGDVRLAMDGAFETSESVGTEAGVVPLQIWQRPVPAVVGAAVLVLLTGFAVRSAMRPAPPLVARFEIPLAMDAAFGAGGRELLAISPDGTQIAFRTDSGWYQRRLDALETVRLIPPETGPGGAPVYSPDGEWISYWSDGELRKMSAGGGTPVRLCDASTVSGMDWTSDDEILFGQGDDGIWRVPSDGGIAERVISVEDGALAAAPHRLPGGDWVVFSERLADNTGSILDASQAFWANSQIVAQSVSTGERRVLAERGTYARYVPTGHLVYAVDGALVAAPFDPQAVRTTGAAVPVVEGVARSLLGSAVHFAIADDGSLVYVPPLDLQGLSGSGGDRRLTWVDREGREEPVSTEPGRYMTPRVSPDGQRVAVSVEGENTDIWIADARDQWSLRRLTFDESEDSDVLWTPDGERIVFSSGRDGGGLFWRAADGAGEAGRLAVGNLMRPYGWGSDGQVVVLSLRNADADIGVLPSASATEVTWLLEEAFSERRPSVSPDGRWLAYQSSESGQPEIHVRPFPNVDDGRWQVSRGGGEAPLWSPDGRELFYRAAGNLMVAEVVAGAAFDFSTPRPLLSLESYAFPSTNRNYDVAPNGQRFVFLKNTSEGRVAAPRYHFVLVQNWFEELKARVPTP